MEGQDRLRRSDKQEDLGCSTGKCREKGKPSNKDPRHTVGGPGLFGGTLDVEKGFFSQKKKERLYGKEVPAIGGTQQRLGGPRSKTAEAKKSQVCKRFAMEKRKMAQNLRTKTEKTEGEKSRMHLYYKRTKRSRKSKESCPATGKTEGKLEKVSG